MLKVDLLAFYPLQYVICVDASGKEGKRFFNLRVLEDAKGKIDDREEDGIRVGEWGEEAVYSRLGAPRGKSMSLNF